MEHWQDISYLTTKIFLKRKIIVSPMITKYCWNDDRLLSTDLMHFQFLGENLLQDFSAPLNLYIL